LAKRFHGLLRAAKNAPAASPVARNATTVYVMGTGCGGATWIIAGSERWREKSGDGIAVATAVRAADHITGGAR
jgi:glycerol-3-phosphate dehydrogenase subunit B